MRILPRVNDAVNEEWISDKTRQIVDGLKLQTARSGPISASGGKLVAGFRLGRGISQPSRPSSVQATKPSAMDRRDRRRSRERRGDVCAEDAHESLGSARNLDCRQDGTPSCIPRLGRASYLFNATDCRDRTGRCRAADRRVESAQGGSRPQCTHPQTLAAGRLSRSAVIGEKALRSYLSCRPSSRHRTAGELEDVASGQHPFARVLSDAKAERSRSSSCWAGRAGAGGWPGAAQAAVPKAARGSARPAGE